jgi:hypothetical protein
MDATIDLLYSTLNKNSIGFDNNEFKREIEAFSLEELNSYIEKLTNGDWKDEEYRVDKLRLCLWHRNIFLIRLPYFHVTTEPKTLGDYVFNSKVFYFVNLKDKFDLDQLKNEIASSCNENTEVVFLVKEYSFVLEQLKQHTDSIGFISILFVDIKNLHYNDLESRSRFIDFFCNLTSVQIQPGNLDRKDIVNFLESGKHFIVGRYPEIDEKRFENFAPMIDILLDKMRLKGKSGFPFWFIIEVNHEYTTPGYPSYDYPDDISFITDGISKLAEDGLGGYELGNINFIHNDDLDFGVRVSMIAGEKLN